MYYNLTLSTSIAFYTMPTIAQISLSCLKISFMISEPPAAPQNVQVSDVGTRTAIMSWDPPDNSFPNVMTDVSSYHISATQSDFTGGNRAAVESKQSRSYQFTDLEEYTTYSFTVAASNAFGEGVESEPQVASTLQAGVYIFIKQ